MTMTEPTDHPTATDERYVATRHLAAPPGQVFALLADPDRHQETEPGDWVRGAIDPQPLTHVGQVFGVKMFFEAFGPYEMHNRVVALEPDRVLAWEPGQYNAEGRLDTGGWTWRYDLAPGEGGDGSDVTLTYDWSRTPQVVRDEVGGLPPFPASFLDESLASLDRALAGAGGR